MIRRDAFIAQGSDPGGDFQAARCRELLAINWDPPSDRCCVMGSEGPVVVFKDPTCCGVSNFWPLLPVTISELSVSHATSNVFAICRCLVRFPLLFPGKIDDDVVMTQCHCCSEPVRLISRSLRTHGGRRR